MISFRDTNPKMNARIVKASRWILFFHQVTCGCTGAFTIRAILSAPEFQDLGTLVGVYMFVKSPLPPFSLLKYIFGVFRSSGYTCTIIHHNEGLDISI